MESYTSLVSKTRGSTLRALRALLCVVSVAAFGGCADDYWSSYLDIDESQFVVNYSLARLADSVGEGDVYDVRDDYVLEGIVTANDEYDNFYQSYVIELGGAAAEIQDGVYNSHVRHRMGYVMAVRLQGLRVIRYKGVLQIGLPAVAGGGVDSFGYTTISDKYVYNRGTTGDVEPLQCTAPELRAMEASIYSYCGRVVAIKGLRYAPSLINDWNLSYDDGVWSGYRPFVDISIVDGEESNSDAVWVNTSSYSKFSGVLIPDGEMELTGILYYGTAGSYSGAPTAPILKLRSQADIISND